MPTPGVGLENHRHQGSHFCNSQGGVCETCSTPTFEGVTIVFLRDKGVERVAFTSLFQHIPIHSLMLTSSMLLKGLILTTTSKNVCITAVVGRMLEKGK